jgi:hypothetical protein
MKKLFYILSFIAIFFAGCIKDKGNYNYHEISGVIVTNLDTSAAGYQVNVGDTLRISPVFTPSLPGSNDSFSAKWETNYPNSLPPGGYHLLSSTKDLSLPIFFAPGKQLLLLTITNNTTGISYFKQVNITIANKYSEGFFVLSNVADTARVDFVNYTPATGVFNTVIDLNKKVNMGLPPGGGKPLEIAYYGVGSLGAGNYVFLLTQNATSKLHPETYSYTNLSPISLSFAEPLPNGFALDKILCPVSSAASAVIAFDNGNIYRILSSPFFSYTLNWNKDYTTNQPFTAAPFAAANSGNDQRVIIFDKTNKRFMKLQTSSGVGNPIDFACRDVVAAQNFPAAGQYDLVYMCDNGVAPTSSTTSSPSFGWAVVQSISTPSQYNVIRFRFTSATGDPQGPVVNFNQPINDPNIANATNFCFAPGSTAGNFMFYSIGGQVFEYDMVSQTAFKVIDKGSQVISLLYFDTRTRTTPAPSWKTQLLVGSYDPSGTIGSNGTFEKYIVAAAPGTNALTLTNTWTGFGQIVSAAYRAR